MTCMKCDKQIRDDHMYCDKCRPAKFTESGGEFIIDASSNKGNNFEYYKTSKEIVDIEGKHFLTFLAGVISFLLVLMFSLGSTGPMILLGILVYIVLFFIAKDNRNITQKQIQLFSVGYWLMFLIFLIV